MNARDIKKVAIFTANRSEFGVLVPIIRAAEMHPALEPKLLVAGMHLEDALGGTKNEIISEGFHVTDYINAGPLGGGPEEIAMWIGRLTLRCAEVFKSICPDFLFVLGDRYELLGPVTAAFLSNIPVVHICGGDVTQGGLLDDTVRHTISRMAHLHFPSTQESKNRLIASGEEPWRIHVVGEPCIDNILHADCPHYQDVLFSLGLDPERKYALCTIHPVPPKDGGSGRAARETFAALAEVDIQVIITYPNGDPGSNEIINEIRKVKNISRFVIEKSLGRLRYLSLLKHAAMVVGNTSSGLVETVPLHVPAVILGSRQEGRPYAANILRTSFDRKRIVQALQTALTDVVFHETVKKCENPYGEGRCGEIIANIIATVPKDERLLEKKYLL